MTLRRTRPRNSHLPAGIHLADGTVRPSKPTSRPGPAPRADVGDDDDDDDDEIEFAPDLGTYLEYLKCSCTRGRPPAFFQGDEKAFSGLQFNVEDETFEFYAPAKMRDDPRWTDVTSLFTDGLQPHIAALSSHPETQPDFAAYMERLARLRGVLDGLP